MQAQLGEWAAASVDFFGVLLVVTRKGGVRENLLVYQVVNIVINVFRSIPFIILLIFLIPLTRAVVGSAIGVKGAILPLVFGTVPFFSRQVEAALSEVNPGLVEAAQSMGCSNAEIIFRVYLREGIPAIARGRGSCPGFRFWLKSAPHCNKELVPWLIRAFFWWMTKRK